MVVVMCAFHVVAADWKNVALAYLRQVSTRQSIDQEIVKRYSKVAAEAALPKIWHYFGIR